MYLWMYQNGYTPLVWAAMNGYLPVVAYLVEKGADMEAKDVLVSDVISLMWNHTSVTCDIYVSVNVSEWVDSIAICCKGRSFTNGWISVGERSWYGGKGSCKWCHIMDVKPTHQRRLNVSVCEYISFDPLHWWRLQGKVIYQWLNICWRKELKWRQGRK